MCSKLRVAVRMRGAFLSFARRLQPVAQAVQQPAHRGRNSPATPARSAPPPALRDSCTSSAAARSGLSARQRIHQGFERGPGCRVGPAECEAFPPPGRRMRSVGASSREISRRPLTNRPPSQTGGRRNHSVAAVADSERLGSRPPAATALVQHGRHGCILRNKGRFQLNVALHTSSMTRKPVDGQLVSVSVPKPHGSPSRPGPTVPVFSYTRCSCRVRPMREAGTATSGTPPPSIVGMTPTSTVSTSPFPRRGFGRATRPRTARCPCPAPRGATEPASSSLR